VSRNILREVRYHLVDLAIVTPDQRHVGLHLQPDGTLAKQWSHACQDSSCELHEVLRLLVRHEYAGLQTRRVKQVANQSIQMVSFVVDRFEQRVRAARLAAPRPRVVPSRVP